MFAGGNRKVRHRSLNHPQDQGSGHDNDRSTAPGERGKWIAHLSVIADMAWGLKGADYGAQAFLPAGSIVPRARN